MEVRVSYRAMTTIDGRRMTTLQPRREQKLAKCTPLKEAASRQFGCRVELYVVVSSLGAIPEETLRHLRRLVLVSASTTAKRMVISTLMASREVYLNRVTTQQRDQNQ